MKKNIWISLFVLIIFSACKKQVLDPQDPIIVSTAYISVVQKYVRQHTDEANYNNIDFDNYRVSKQKVYWYLRLALRNKLLSSDFVLLQTDSLGNTSGGKIIHLEKAPGNKAIKDRTNYNGRIDISSLDKKEVVHSAITHGYIESWHPELFDTTSKIISNIKEASFPVTEPYDDLAEFVIVAYVTSEGSNGGLPWSDYMMLGSLFSGSSGKGGTVAPGAGANQGNGYSYGVYSPVNNATGSAGSSSHMASDVVLTPDESFSRPAIDVNAWMKCFTDIPDAGATSSITLYGDLPVDSDPSVGLNIWNGNTGHCFLQLNKTNGSQSVTQIIGFTAQSAGKAIINADAFVPSKLVDNAGHKYNCSIKMNLSAAGMNTIIEQIKLLSDMPYSIVNYDCLDFGLDIFNSVRPNPLVISKVFDPNQPFSNIATGPKLYTLLQDMIDNGSPESNNIRVSGSVYAGVSHGPCN